MTDAEKAAKEIKQIEAIMAVAEAEMAKAKAEQPGPLADNRPY
jgi:hypothetical protein